jgi:Xaa-Pro aminopeptidase
MTAHGVPTIAYERRRHALSEALRDAVLFIAGQPEAVFANDVHYRYRPDTNIRYLTGFEEPCHLLIDGAGVDPGLTLFVRPRDATAETWNGVRAGVDGAKKTFGADFAYALDEWPAILERHLRETARFYWTQSRDGGVNERVLGAIRAVNAQRPRNGRASLIVEDANLLLGEMRVVKRDDELAVLRQACEVSAAAHRAVVSSVRPGDFEYHVEALVEYCFRSSGCAGPAYGTIAAGGANATVLHYTRNDRVLADGELLLLDAGGELGGYCGDITRTIPIGANFSPSQARLYDVVLSAQLEAIEAVRPGATIDGIHSKALAILVRGLIDLGLLPGTVEEAIANKSYERYYMHRTSHWLGMDVHDAGRYAVDGAPRKLEPGMVLTVEPGLYVPPDDPSEYRGIGIRIEDDVAVTTTGCEVLTVDAPKARDEIETLRRSALSDATRAQRVPAFLRK